MMIVSTALLLFLVMDPVGNIPPFLAVLKNVDPRRHKRIIIRELSIALAVLMFFLFFGPFVLRLLQIKGPALSIAGGIILFMIAIKMVFPVSEGTHTPKENEEPFIVPLAIPLVAGPSAIATVLLLMTDQPQKWPEWVAALILAWVASGVILLASSKLSDVLGQKGLTALERLMGMILTTVAVQMFISGLQEYLKRGL
jgi:multiple antibiotic resistance protein